VADAAASAFDVQKSRHRHKAGKRRAGTIFETAAGARL
jgi:hypothetical protein